MFPPIAGFTVGQDFSLTTYRAGAQETEAAAAQVRELGRQLCRRIEELLELDEHVANRIAAAADDVGTLTFADTDEADQDRDAAIHPVDNRVVKEAPPQPPPPDPTPGRLPPVNSDDDVKRVLDPLQTAVDGDQMAWGPSQRSKKYGMKLRQDVSGTTSPAKPWTAHAHPTTKA